MCTSTAPALAFRAAADVMTYGSYEAIRHVPGPIGNVPKGTEALVDKTTGGPGNASYVPGLDPKPPQPSADMPGPSSGGGDAGGPPTPTPVAPTESAAMIARRKLAALRMGLLSTMTTGGQGVTSTPNLLIPTASAGGGVKTALGQ